MKILFDCIVKMEYLTHCLCFFVFSPLSMHTEQKNTHKLSSTLHWEPHDSPTSLSWLRGWMLPDNQQHLSFHLTTSLTRTHKFTESSLPPFRGLKVQEMTTVLGLIVAEL